MVVLDCLGHSSFYICVLYFWATMIDAMNFFIDSWSKAGHATWFKLHHSHTFFVFWYSFLLFLLVITRWLLIFIGKNVLIIFDQDITPIDIRCSCRLIHLILYQLNSFGYFWLNIRLRSTSTAFHLYRFYFYLFQLFFSIF